MSSFLIIWCDEDQSYSLVRDHEAVCDAELIAPGQSIKFFFNKKQYQGIVKEIGDEDDYDSLVQRLKVLNATNKAQRQSFHADLPRKNRGKGMSEVVKGLQPKSKRKQASKDSARKASQQSSPTEPSCSSSVNARHPKVSRQSQKQQGVHLNDVDMNVFSEDNNGSEDDENESIMSSSQFIKAGKKGAKAHHALEKLLSQQDSSDDSLDEDDEQNISPPSSPKIESISPAAAKAIAQAKRKQATQGKDADLSVLKKLRMNSSVDSASKAVITAPEAPKPVPEALTQEEDSSIHNVYEDSESEAAAEDDKEVTGSKADKKSKKRPQCDKELDNDMNDEPLFEMMRHPDPKKATTEVVEVRGRSKELVDKHFFVATKDLQEAKLAVNATTFSKKLIAAAFSDKALLECSLSGGEYRAAGRDNITRKPALNQDVVAVIVDVTLKRQSIKKWNPAATKREILAGLRQKLVDLKPRLSKKLRSNESKKNTEEPKVDPQ